MFMVAGAVRGEGAEVAEWRSDAAALRPGVLSSKGNELVVFVFSTPYVLSFCFT